MDKYYIKPADWERIYSFLQIIKGIRIKNELVSRRFLEGVYFIMRTGAQWRELPHYYGKWRSVHKRFEEWCSKGLWSRVLSDLTKDYDRESVMIDSTFIRAHSCAAGYEKGQQTRECLGRSKGGFTTKIHAVVDALGQAIRLTLTPGQRNDITQAPKLLEGIEHANVIADKGYDSNAFVNQLKAQNCIPVIPSRSNRKTLRPYDKYLYKERHLIECFFNKIKHFRRIFSRFDKKAAAFLGFLTYASIILWLR
jgi:transposase